MEPGPSKEAPRAQPDPRHAPGPRSPRYPIGGTMTLPTPLSIGQMTLVCSCELPMARGTQISYGTRRRT